VLILSAWNRYRAGKRIVGRKGDASMRSYVGPTSKLLPLTLILAAADAPKAIDLPGDRLFPESVSIAPNGTAYVGSVNGGVLRVTLATGKAEAWIKPGAYGSGALFGVLADTRNKLLWTCTNDLHARGVTVSGADAGSWLKGFDLATGQGKLSLALSEGSICNDMAVGKDGSVYVTDTGHPRILRWKPGASALDTWVEDPVFAAGLDGLAFGSDGNLYVNNVRNGMFFRVAMGADGKAGTITKLTPSRALGSPDGMRPLGGLDFALAEGQGRITRLSVKGDSVEATTLAEGIAQPTGVAPNGNTIWYVQGQLGALFNPNAPQPKLPFQLAPVAAR
jgi:sugar lactone lactonase YvrE